MYLLIAILWMAFPFRSSIEFTWKMLPFLRSLRRIPWKCLILHTCLWKFDNASYIIITAKENRNQGYVQLTISYLSSFVLRTVAKEEKRGSEKGSHKWKNTHHDYQFSIRLIYIIAKWCQSNTFFFASAPRKKRYDGLRHFSNLFCHFRCPQVKLHRAKKRLMVDGYIYMFIEFIGNVWRTDSPSSSWSGHINNVRYSPPHP